MTAIVESYHTHAEGADKGWWGELIHPAHLDNANRPIPGTAWRLEAHAQTSLEGCRAWLWAKTAELHPEELQAIDG